MCPLVSPGSSDPPGGRRSARADTSISSLIILIAVLLVATSTAGVFLEVTGTLQGQTEAAGEDAERQVGGGVEVVAAFGSVDNGTVDTVEFTVTAAGDRPVDLRDLAVLWTGSTGTATYVHSSDGSDRPIFTVTATEGSGDRLVLDGRDRATLAVDTVDAGGRLESGGQVTVTFLGDSSTTYEFRVPATLSGDSVEL